MNNLENSSTNYVPLTELARLLKSTVEVPVDAKDKRPLDAVIVGVLTEFFSKECLVVDPTVVESELSSMRSTEVEMVLAKLRSLLEKQARRDIAEYCQSITKARRTSITAALHAAGIHHFRENLETDLYVGIHTAISANFKMMGVVYSNAQISKAYHAKALTELFRALSIVASQPLGVLLSLEGIFWDRGLYNIPTALRWMVHNDEGAFYLDKDEIIARLARAQITEKPLGCPAMRAQTPLGQRVLEFVQERCCAVAERYQHHFCTAS